MAEDLSAWLFPFQLFFFLLLYLSVKVLSHLAGGSGEDCAVRRPQRRPHLHRLPDGLGGEPPEGGREGAAPDVDDLPDVHGADLQVRQDVVGQGTRLLQCILIILTLAVRGYVKGTGLCSRIYFM